MKIIKGKPVFENYSEMLDPRHTAVLVIDMQKEGIAPKGYFGRKGANVQLVAAIVPPLAAFLRAARDAGAKVVYVNQTTLREGKGDSPAWLHLKEHSYKLVPPAMGLEDDYMIQGTEGQQVIPDLAPGPNDIVVEKGRASAFIHTSLNLILGSNGIESLVITGESSYGCALNTLMDATCYDYYTVVAQDLIAGPNQRLHEIALELIRARYDCLPSSHITKIWRKE
jgi:nicotinamidase-related amidase